MKRIAMSLAVLGLSAGTAFAAMPAMAAVTTHSQAHSAARMTSALNLLEAKGYASFNNFKVDGDNFSATVTKNGHTETVIINPDSGQITTQS